ncbi:MAG TPA: protein-methionine-sulfoxide reductase heme-binding subunit MsrQ [Steroidobacteraceae bacterium]|nr:protein-methionine-sulfoxide reductase heme-binding subunit MsrQ [Steroidobacteraceae bacterium]
MPTRPIDRRYRYFYKPVVFCACLVPFAGCLGGILALQGFGWARGFDLGVDPVRYVLDVLGKTALNLLLITLLVSPARALTGWSNLLRLRRMLGLFAFFYALMHFTMYIGPFQGFSWRAITQDIAKRPFITIGFADLLLLVPLAVTSTQKMMRRLGRRWQQLHRLIYLIAALGVLHYWKMLKLGWREPLLYAGILAVLLGWRLWRRWQNQLRSAAIRPAAAAGSVATSRSAVPKAPGKA